MLWSIWLWRENCDYSEIILITRDQCKYYKIYLHTYIKSLAFAIAKVLICLLFYFILCGVTKVPLVFDCVVFNQRLIGDVLYTILNVFHVSGECKRSAYI